jgi:hypothetical protein
MLQKIRVVHVGKDLESLIKVRHKKTVVTDLYCSCRSLVEHGELQIIIEVAAKKNCYASLKCT